MNKTAIYKVWRGLRPLDNVKVTFKGDGYTYFIEGKVVFLQFHQDEPSAVAGKGWNTYKKLIVHSGGQIDIGCWQPAENITAIKNLKTSIRFISFLEEES
jgi:hypothetical protein